MTERDYEDYQSEDYEGGVDDAGTFDPAESLSGQPLEEPYDTGYSPPENEPDAVKFGTTAEEEAEGESLDQRLAQEEPDVDELPVAGEDEDARSGRLVDTNAGIGPDDEETLIADDAGLAGSAASAEEAAVHVIDEDRVDDDTIGLDVGDDDTTDG